MRSYGQKVTLKMEYKPSVVIEAVASLLKVVLVARGRCGSHV
jgi:hypothetical protein